MLRGESCAVQPSSRGSGDCGSDESGGLFGGRPARDVDPFAGFQIFVMTEEMGDLIAQDRWQILIGPHSDVERMELIDRDGEDLFVEPCSSSIINAPIGRQRTTAPGTTEAGPTINTSIGSPSCAKVCGTKP